MVNNKFGSYKDSNAQPGKSESYNEFKAWMDGLDKMVQTEDERAKKFIEQWNKYKGLRVRHQVYGINGTIVRAMVTEPHSRHILVHWDSGSETSEHPMLFMPLLDTNGKPLYDNGEPNII